MQELTDRCLHAAQPGRALDADARAIAASREPEPSRFHRAQCCPVVPASRVSDFQFNGVTRL